MGIGTSKGAFYRDEGHYAASMWDPRYDDNEIEGPATADNNVVTPKEIDTNRGLEKSEIDNLGIEVSGKNIMPFPDNKDPRTDFDYRYPKELPPSGILNDLKKPTGQTVPLVRRISMNFGTGSPAEEAEQPTAAGPIETVVKGAYEGLGKVAKGAIESSETMRTTGVYNPEPVLEGSLFTLGTGAISGLSTPVGKALAEGTSNFLDTVFSYFPKSMVVDKSVPLTTEQTERILRQQSNIRRQADYTEIDNAFYDQYLALNERYSGIPGLRVNNERQADYQRELARLEDSYDRIFQSNGYGTPLANDRNTITRDILDEALETNNLHPRFQTHAEEARYHERYSAGGIGTDQLGEVLTPSEIGYSWGEIGKQISKKGDMSLHFNKAFREYDPSDRYQQFVFKKGDKVGTISLSNEGERLYVEGMYGEQGAAMHDFSRKEIKNLLEQIADYFPEAKRIAGFRVSGARGKAGAAGHAEMWLPGRKPKDLPANEDIARRAREAAIRPVRR